MNRDRGAQGPQHPGTGVHSASGGGGFRVNEDWGTQELGVRRAPGDVVYWGRWGSALGGGCRRIWGAQGRGSTAYWGHRNGGVQHYRGAQGSGEEVAQGLGPPGAWGPRSTGSSRETPIFGSN